MFKRLYDGSKIHYTYTVRNIHSNHYSSWLGFFCQCQLPIFGPKTHHKIWQYDEKWQVHGIDSSISQATRCFGRLTQSPPPPGSNYPHIQQLVLDILAYHIISYYTFLYIIYIYIFSSTMTSTYIYLHIYIKTCSRHHHSFHIIFDNIWLGVQNLQTFKAEERGSTQPRLPNRLLADYQHTGDQSVGDIYLPTNNHWMSSVTTCQVQRW